MDYCIGAGNVRYRQLIIDNLPTISPMRTIFSRAWFGLHTGSDFIPEGKSELYVEGWKRQNEFLLAAAVFEIIKQAYEEYEKGERTSYIAPRLQFC